MSDPKPTATTISILPDPCEPRMTPRSQDAAPHDAAPPVRGREQIMDGFVWSALCLAEDAAHKLHDCDARRVRDRTDPTLLSAICGLRAALACLTQEAE